MEVKEWTYEEIPEFTEEVEGAHIIRTTGDEMGVQYIHNVEYAEVDGTKLHLQILLPFSRNEQEMIRPCVVYVQGSAWFPQDVFHGLCRISKLCERGYVIAVVEYRHSGIAPFPAQIMDARNAVRFIRAHADQFHVDPEKIVIAGDSSGGHTAMFAGIIHDDITDSLFPGVSAEVSGIINYYGSCSVMKEDSNPSQILHCQPDSPEGMVMGHVDLRNNMELKKKLSVECNITEETVMPPTLIFHGTKDRIVNCECSVILYRQMKKCGKDAQLYFIKGGDHGGAEFWTDEVLDIADAFLKKCFHKKERKLPGVPFSDEREYEIRNRQIAREAAAEGMVLLKNENNMLPISKGTPIALYGAGAAHTIKGGTGSGDVNSRETVSILKGLTDAGYPIVSRKWLDEYDNAYAEARLKWRDDVWQKEDDLRETNHSEMNFFHAYTAIPFIFPVGGLPEKEDAEIAIYVLSRQAGEGKDRINGSGDYMISVEEKQIIDRICALYPHVALVLNTGGVMDLSFTDDHPNIESIIYMHQPGMEAGNAFADLISGSVVPGGKLTDSWPLAYSDYPNASTFSHNNGNVEKEEYIEGIYVGYRYFDTFEVPVRHCFGYGLSYTGFSIETLGIELFNPGTEDPEIGVKVKVTNTGEHYSGREVVQIYVSCPQDKLDKEYRRLAGFYKTKLLAPGESQEETVRFPVSAMASYHESQSAWMAEEGCYGIFVGNSLETSFFSASVQMDGNAVLSKTEHICPLQERLDELKGIPEKVNERRNAWLKEAAGKPEITVHSFDIITREISYERNFHDFSDETADFIDSLRTGQLIELATGDISKAQGSNIGAAGNSVPGSAAETSGCAAEQGLPGIVLADGPAGLRLNRTYQAVNGKPLSMPIEMALEDGYLARGQSDLQGEIYYQYCTAIPVGTVLAQSWDTETMKKCGSAVAEEMQEFGVTLWLAPGMNIHRNPLCGRNFEYYSEDPLLSGIMAAAMTDGVQSRKGCGTTIKHFACNNQEDNRKQSDSIVSERALREIYLKGFETAVRKSRPMAIMTSYNLVNGIHAANSYDLCTKAARNEWGYQGLIMTDWTTTHNDPDCTASGCMRAGNDIVMPGCDKDHENLKEELESGTLDIRELKLAVGHLVDVIRLSESDV